MSLENQTLNKLNRCKKKNGSSLLHLPAAMPPEGQRRGPRGQRLKGLAAAAAGFFFVIETYKPC